MNSDLLLTGSAFFSPNSPKNAYIVSYNSFCWISNILFLNGTFFAGFLSPPLSTFESSWPSPASDAGARYCSECFVLTWVLYAASFIKIFVHFSQVITSSPSSYFFATTSLLDSDLSSDCDASFFAWSIFCNWLFKLIGFWFWSFYKIDF